MLKHISFCDVISLCPPYACFALLSHYMVWRRNVYPIITNTAHYPVIPAVCFEPQHSWCRVEQHWAYIEARSGVVYVRRKTFELSVAVCLLLVLR